MSKTTRLALLTVCLVIALSCVFVACSSTKYTLTYNTAGGEIEGGTTVMFKEGAKITPPTPENGNFVFDGWYADFAYTQKFESFDNMPAQDVTVYAKWKTYTSGKINFVVNGGSEVEAIRGVTGQPVTAPANPTKTGYKFAGWCEDATLNNLYTFSTYPNGEITLYAKWQQDSAQFAYVTFDLNGVKTEVAVRKGQPVEAPVAPQGQNCVWYTSESKNVAYNFENDVIGNTTLYGVLCTEGLVVQGNTVVSYNGTEEQVFIPQSYNGVYVTTVAASAFVDNNTITSVYLPSTVTAISNYAFQNCEYLASINLESTVKSVGAFAFAGCKRLVSDLDLTGLTEIQPNSFANCRWVENVSFADNLVSIGAYAFADCSALTTITLPSTVETIGEFAFTNTGITTLNIPTALTTLGQGVVKGCDIQTITTEQNRPFVVDTTAVYADNGKTLLLQFGSVETLVLPSTVEAVSPWAFSNATVTNLDVSNQALTRNSLCGIQGLQSLKVSNFDSDNKFLAYWFGASSAIDNTTNSFYVPTTLKTVQFTGEQTTVPQYAFYGCTSVESILGFENVVEIGVYAYAHTSVNNIEIGAQTTQFHGTSFAGANNLQLTVAATNPVYAMYEGAVYTKDLSTLVFVPSGLTEVTFASEMVEIGEYAFAKSSVLEVVVPNTVEEIGFGAFEGVTNLQKLTVPFIGGGSADTKYMVYIFGVGINYNPETLALSMTGDKYPATLKEITLSNPVTTIDDCAFFYCKGLEVLNNDADVTSIGNFAFYNTGFKTVEIADTVTTIGFLAYSKSEWINEIVIGSGVTEIKQQAFAMLPSLQKITFKEGTQDLVIGAEAFLCEYIEGRYGYEGRSYLEEINFSNNIVSIGEMSFGFAGAYGTDVKNFAKLEIKFDVENSRLKTVAFMAFAYSAAKEVTLPATIETVGAVAFFSCQVLTTVRFGSSSHEASNLTLIDDGAFAGCFELHTVYMYKTVTNVADVPVLGQKVDESTKDMKVFHSSTPTVYVPKSSLSTYEAVWTDENVVLRAMGGK